MSQGNNININYESSHFDNLKLDSDSGMDNKIDSRFDSGKNDKDILSADKLAMKLKKKKQNEKNEQQIKMDQKIENKGLLSSVFDFVFGSTEQSSKKDKDQLQLLKSEHSELRNMEDTIAVAIGKQQYSPETSPKKSRNKENVLIDDKSSLSAKKSDVSDEISKLIGKGIDLK